MGATNINAHSSRSHAIVTLTVIQRSRSAPKHGLPTSALQQKVGRVHLVDLAGSERVYMTGNTMSDDRQPNQTGTNLFHTHALLLVTYSGHLTTTNAPFLSNKQSINYPSSYPTTPFQAPRALVFEKPPTSTVPSVCLET